MLRKVILVFLLSLTLSACGMPWTDSQRKETPEGKLLMEVFSDLQNHKFEDAKAKFDESLLTDPRLEQGLKAMGDIIPSTPPKATHFLGWSVLKSLRSGRSVHVVAQYEFDSQNLVADAVLAGEPESLKVVGFHLTPRAKLADNLQLAGKPWPHYLFLAAMGLSLLTSLVSFVICIRTPKFPRKWLWAVLTLVSLVSFTLRWSDGALAVLPLSFLLLGAGFVVDPISGTIFKTAIPVGALVFLFWKYPRVKP